MTDTNYMNNFGAYDKLLSMDRETLLKVAAKLSRVAIDRDSYFAEQVQCRVAQIIGTPFDPHHKHDDWCKPCGRVVMV